MMRDARRFRPTLESTSLETRLAPSDGVTPPPTDPSPALAPVPVTPPTPGVGADAHAEVLNNPLFLPGN